MVAHARSNQVRGIDPDQEMDFPVNRPLPDSEAERRLRSPQSGPFDPLRNLKSPIEITRAEAASYIGWARRYDCAPALIGFLSRRSGSGPDVTSALWALGQLGSPSAVPTLLQWARRGSPEARLEALRSLAELKAGEGLPVFLEGLTRTPSPNDPISVVDAERRLCFESLVALGNMSCAGPLRKLADRNRGREAWSGLNDPGNDPARTRAGREAVAALAACGDTRAEKIILQSVVAGSTVTQPAALLRAAAEGGNIGGFPWGFWIGKSLLLDNPPHPTPWPSLCEALDLLKGRPAVLDDLLRRAAVDPSMPAGGRVLLIGCLQTPGPSDFIVLDGVWFDALGEAAVVTDLAVPAGRGQRSTLVRYNLNACAVVHAYGRFRNDEALRRLWKTCPPGDVVLQGEIALALSRTGSRRGAPVVLEYVTREWDRAARAPDFATSLRARDDMKIAELLLVESNAFDYSYRNHDITSFLLSTGDRRTMQALVLDPALHPYLRLYWIQRLAGSQNAAWMMDLAVKGLDLIETDETKDEPLLAALAASTRSTVQWFRNRGVNETHPTQ